MLKKLSFTDAAEKVLREFANRKPKHYKNIIDIAVKKGWILTKGLTPETTLTAVIGSENRRRLRRGEEPRFIVYGRGLYGLSEWEPKGLLRDIQERNEEVKEKLRKSILRIPPEKFEELIGQLLAEIGFDGIEVTSKSADGGIDVKGKLVVGGVIETKMAVQVKRWKHNVQTPVVTQLRGSLGPHEQGLIITTSDFSKGAIKEANDPYKAPIALMNGKELVDLMVEYQVGVKKKEISVLELAESEKLLEEVVGRETSAKVEIFGRTKGKRFNAFLINLKQVELDGKTYRSTSGAARSICSYPVDGWNFWKYRDEKGRVQKIDNLRKKLREGSF